MVVISNGQGEVFVPLPYDGVRPWAYDFDVAASNNNFLLVYSGEFRLRDGKLLSQSEPGLDGDVNWVGANVAQMYSFDGVAQGEPIWITSQTNQGHRPGVGALSDGSYLVIWQTNNPIGYPELGNMIGYIVARHISADGTQVGETFIVATGRNLLAEGISPTVNEVNGEIIVAWDEYSSQFDRSTITAGASGDVSRKINGSDLDDVLISFEGDDEIYGHGGNDQLAGGAGSDYLSGGFGADALVGGDGSDVLLAGSGDDYVDAGGGDDLIVGGDGAGNDRYIGGAGVDTIKYTSALAGITVNLSASTNQAKSTLSGDRAGIGIDQLSDIENIIAGNYDDVLIGNGSNNQIEAGSGNDTINGGTGTDTLIGGLGNDILIGGGGADVMWGGEGDDVYHVDNLNDRTLETVSDTDVPLDIQRYFEVWLQSNPTWLEENGFGGIQLQVITSSEIFTGLQFSNPGRASGFDYWYKNISESIDDGGEDLVYSSVTWSLGKNVENLSLTGSAAINGTGNTLNNVITGNSGNNTLSGGTGTDTLIGGLGNDTYLTDGGDTITEAASAGTDTVQSSANHTLAANVENLTLTGSSAINGTGNSLNNVLTGNSGNNTLSGGTGTDTLIGGLGNDTYITDGGDTITEAENAGIDTVQSSVTHTLAANVENLTLTGSAAINGTGNALNNVLTGNSGNNTLSGGTGTDTLDGGSGNDVLNGGGGTDVLDGGEGSDVYLVTLLADKTAAEITDTGTTGTDELRFAATTVGTLTLLAGDTGLERVVIGTGTGASAATTGKVALNVDATLSANGLTITGNAGNNTLTGSGFADTLDGGAGNDALNGGLGNDVLIGGLGQDTLTGGIGNDIFKFSLITESGTTATKADVITDFVKGQDVIDLSGLDAFLATKNVNDTFIWQGTAAFSNTTQGEVRYEKFDATGTANDHTMIWIDNDKDTGVEMGIRLTGLHDLTASDFIL
jgi:Ca2+-binding RTX toxin-like protein